MMKRMTSHSAVAEAARIGVAARKGLLTLAAAVLVAGALTAMNAERPAVQTAAVLETGRAIQFRPSASQMSEAMGAFDQFQDKPEVAPGANGRQMALSTAR